MLYEYQYVGCIEFSDYEDYILKNQAYFYKCTTWTSWLRVMSIHPWPTILFYKDTCF